MNALCTDHEVATTWLELLRAGLLGKEGEVNQKNMLSFSFLFIQKDYFIFNSSVNISR